MDNGKKIAIANPLLGANLRLDLLGRKLLAIAIANIDTRLGKNANEEQSYQEIKVSVGTNKINKLLQYHKGEKSLNEVCKRVALNDSVIVKEDKKTGYLHISHIFTDIWAENGMFTAVFNKRLNVYINDLRTRFTVIELEHILQLKSTYAIILFCLIWQHKNTHRPCKIGIEELRQLLGTEGKTSYRAMCNFVSRCIDLPIKEINTKLGDVLKVSYTIEKIRKKAAYFVFDTKYAQAEETSDTPKYENTAKSYFADCAKELTALTIAENGKPTLSEKNALAFLEKFNLNLLDIRLVIAAAKEQKSKGVVIGGGWIRQALKDRYRPNDINLVIKASNETMILQNHGA